MNVEKIIRVLGYIVYTALWSPIIVICFIVMPILWLAMGIRMGMSYGEIVTTYAKLMRTSIQHDINFIQTGIW